MRKLKLNLKCTHYFEGQGWRPHEKQYSEACHGQCPRPPHNARHANAQRWSITCGPHHCSLFSLCIPLVFANGSSLPICIRQNDLCFGTNGKRSLQFLLCSNLFVLLGCSITDLKVSCEDASSQAFCIHKTLLLCCVLSLYKLSDFRMIDGGPICPKFCI